MGYIDRLLRSLYSLQLAKPIMDEVSAFNKTVKLRETTLIEFENATRGLKYEFVGLFHNNILIESFTPADTFREDPKADPAVSCLFSPVVCRGRWDITLSHNHPMGGPISFMDVNAAIELNLLEIRATDSNGAWVVEKNLNMKEFCSKDVVPVLSEIQSEHQCKPQPIFNKARVDAWRNNYYLMSQVPLKFISKEQK